MTRGERIVVLVWSLGDAIAVPGGSGEVRRPAPTELVECEACGGSGGVEDRFGRAMRCPGCGGRGRFWIDSYTGERTDDPGSTVPAPEVVTFRRRVGCAWCQEGDRGRWDAGRGTWVSSGRRFEALPRGSGVRAGERCESCDGTGFEWVSAELEVPSARSVGSNDRVAWRIGGSYREVAAALDELRAWNRGAWRLLVEAAADGRWPLLGHYELASLGFVEARMPARIVVSGDVLAAWRDRERRAEQIAGPQRDHRIRDLIGQGVAPAVVARRAGLSESQVRRIAYPRP